MYPCVSLCIPAPSVSIAKKMIGMPRVPLNKNNLKMSHVHHGASHTAWADNRQKNQRILHNVSTY